MIVVTTLLDAEEVTAHDLAELYRARWNAELDLRSLKQTMQMDILRCKTPELVRKEIWTHILAYNLIRTIIAQAANKHRHRTPYRSASREQFKHWKPFNRLIATQGDCSSTRRNDSTISCSTLSLLIELPIDPIASNHVSENADKRSTIE